MASVKIGSTYAGPPTAAIERFDVTDTVYVELVGHDVNTRNLGGIVVGRSQSPHMADLHVATDIAMGAVRVTHGGRTYEWSLAQVSIVLELENASVLPGSLYNDILQQGGVVTADREEEHRKSDTRLQGEAGAEVKARWISVPFLSFMFNAKGSAAKTWQDDRSSKSDSETKPTVHFSITPATRRSPPVGRMATRA